LWTGETAGEAAFQATYAITVLQSSLQLFTWEGGNSLHMMYDGNGNIYLLNGKRFTSIKPLTLLNQLIFILKILTHNVEAS
jgi:hypothetical protein